MNKTPAQTSTATLSAADMETRSGVPQRAISTMQPLNKIRLGGGVAIAPLATPEVESGSFSPEENKQVEQMISNLEHMYLGLTGSRRFSYQKERAIFQAIAALSAMRKLD
jgi:hypothetical protein